MSRPLFFKAFLAVACLFAVTNPGPAQQFRPLDAVSKTLKPDRLLVYKTVGDRDLKLHIFEPEGHTASDCRSVFLIIHGGGWKGGDPWRCYPFADYFRKQGMLAITIDYRLIGRSDNATVFDCVRDGKSAVRFIRQHAAELGADSQRIVVSGCSAGGHIAAGTALFEDVHEPHEDSSVSSQPNAMVLYYPVIDTSAAGYGQQKIGDHWQQLSPLHHVRTKLPPTILFHGTGDTVTPYVGAVAFHEKMTAADNNCELISHPDGGHGYLIFDVELFQAAMQRTQQFLLKHKLMTAPSNSEAP